MSGPESTHVQTELSGTEYEQFRKFASERGLSIKDAGHEALVEWVERQQRVDPTDPAFTVLEDLDAESLPPSAETDARDLDDLIEEGDGDDEEFTLAPEPSTRS